MTGNKGGTDTDASVQMVEGDFPVRFQRWGVAERLRDVVKQHGGNQVVAQRAGVPLGTLNNYLRGRYDVKFPAVVAIAAACQVSLDWLATGHGTQQAEWYDPAMFEGDLSPDQIAHGPAMPLYPHAESTAPPPPATAQSQSQRQSGVAEPQESLVRPAAIDTGHLEQAIAIVHTLAGLHTLTPSEAASRIAKTYAILSGAKP